MTSLLAFHRTSRKLLSIDCTLFEALVDFHFTRCALELPTNKQSILAPSAHLQMMLVRFISGFPFAKRSAFHKIPEDVSDP